MWCTCSSKSRIGGWLEGESVADVLTLPDPSRMTTAELQQELARGVSGKEWRWPTARRRAIRAELVKRLYSGGDNNFESK
jgi:hypothetical protein